MHFRIVAALALALAGRWGTWPVVWAETPPESASSASRVGSGFTYQHDQVPRVPWSVQIARVNRSRTNFFLETTLAGNTSIGIATVSEQMSHWPRARGRPMAAINGDYFVRRGSFEGDPEGLQIAHGEVISAPNSKSCFWVDADNGLHLSNVVSQFSVTLPGGEILPLGLNEELSSDQAVLYSAAVGGSTRTWKCSEYILERDSTQPWLPLRIGETYTARIREVRKAGNTLLTPDTLVLSLPRALEKRLRSAGLATGAVVQLALRTLPDLKGARLALGGGPALLRDGQRTDFRSERVRHPRTAIGWNRDDFFLVQVDGRQPGLSVGMTLTELADYLQKLGCTEALNLDGGGSSTLWADGQVMNNPSEGSERPPGNALVIVRTMEARPARANSPPTSAPQEK